MADKQSCEIQVCNSFKVRCLDWLDHLDATLGGMALGASSFARTITFNAQLLHSPQLYYIFGAPLFIISLAFMLLFIFRVILFSRKIGEELRTLQGICNYSAFFMTLTQLAAHAGSVSNMVSIIGFAFGSVAQFLLFFYFLGRFVYLRALPEPIWFPPTVGLAVIVISGNEIGIAPTVMKMVFWFSFVICTVLTPWVMIRAMNSTLNVASDPTIFILTAPFSLVTVAWITMNGPISLQGPYWHVVFTTVLYAFSFLGFGLMLVCVIQRRESIFARFNSSWSATTFSLAITGKAALCYSWYITSHGFYIWSQLFSWPCLAFVLLVIIAYILFITKLNSKGPSFGAGESSCS